jgi:phage replication initiation protein
MEKKGYFVNRRPLASDEKGARTPEKGRTLYVGNRENGKQLCIYEKGKQTSDLIHPNWIRWEFRVGNKDGRVIPYEVLTNPSAFFLGAFRSFPYIFRNLTDATPEIIKTQQDRLAVATVDAWVNNAKRSYGAGLGVLEKLGVDTAKLFCVLTRDGLQNSLGLPDSLSAIDTVDHLYSQLHDTSLSIDNP